MHQHFIDRGRLWGPVCLTAAVFAMQSPAHAAKQIKPRLPEFAAPASETADDTELLDPGALIKAGTAQGEVEVVKERYSNGKVKVERQVTLDPEGNYVNHGTWKMWSQSGDVVAEGHYDMGQRVGTWSRWMTKSESPVLGRYPFSRFRSPFVSTATFADGKLDGEWLILDAEQRKCLQISFSEGQRHGPVITWLPNGNTYQQATYDHGTPTGDFFEMDRNGELAATATYVDGRRIVTQTTHHDTRNRQKKLEEMYLAPKTVEKTPDEFWTLTFAEYATEGEAMRHGPSKAWFENGVQRHEGLYEHDKREGTFTFWHPNGQVSVTGSFQNDEPSGLWVWWHEMGQKAAIGKYRAGALVGKWRWWNESGRLTRQSVYDGTEQIASDPGEILQLGRVPDEAETITK